MDAVQRMRKKAQDTGNLKSTEQQKVETKVIENKSVIVVEQANPQVVYVPSYDPVVVYGPPVYPYPPIYYPPAGYYAAGLAISFGVGMMMGAAWGGGWGWGCGWGGNNNININNNNNFNRNSNIGGGNRNNIGSGNRPSQQPGRGGGGRGDSGWKHNPQHRGGAPYGDRGTADRFGGTARGDSLSNRQANRSEEVGRQGGNLASSRGGGAGVSNRASGPAAAAVPRAWDQEGAVAAVVAVGDGGERPKLRKGSHRSIHMKPTSSKTSHLRTLWITGILALLLMPGHLIAQESAAKSATYSVAVGAKTFGTPEQAADALVAAAEQFDELALKEIFGPGGDDIVFSGEY